MTTAVISKSAPITPKSERQGCAIDFCCPSWFVAADQFKVPNPSVAAKDLMFGGDDLNYLARVLHAEASGSGAIKDDAERFREKEAIINVLYNRLNVPGYDPNNWTRGRFQTFRDVATAVKRLSGGGLSGVQFESVIGSDGSGTSKFKSTDGPVVDHLGKADCKDFEECFNAIRRFLVVGPNEHMNFDNFRAAGKKTAPKGQTVIGGNRFWKMGQ